MNWATADQYPSWTHVSSIKSYMWTRLETTTTMPVASRGESSVRTTLHDEDLSSYEAAVLARKAPTHLSLPRRATIPPPPIDPFTVNRDLSSSLAGVFGPSSDLSLQPPLSSSSSSSSFHLRQDSPSTSSTSTAPGSSSRASSVATEDDDHPSPHDAIPVDDSHHQSNSIKTLSSTHLDTKNQYLIPDQPDAGRMIMIPSPMDPFAFGMNWPEGIYLSIYLCNCIPRDDNTIERGCTRP